MDRFDEMAERVLLDLACARDGRRLLVADALRVAHVGGVDEAARELHASFPGSPEASDVIARQELMIASLQGDLAALKAKYDDCERRRMAMLLDYKFAPRKGRGPYEVWTGESMAVDGLARDEAIWLCKGLEYASETNRGSPWNPTVRCFGEIIYPAEVSE